MSSTDIIRSKLNIWGKCHHIVKLLSFSYLKKRMTILMIIYIITFVDFKNDDPTFSIFICPINNDLNKAPENL